VRQDGSGHRGADDPCHYAFPINQPGGAVSCPSLGLGVVGDAGLDHEPVVAGGSHHDGMAHGDAGHPIARDDPLVVGEQVGRCRPETAQHGVDARQCGGKGAVPGGNHHPEPAPGHPGTEQTRRPSAHFGTLGPVVLCPHPWFGHPRSVGAAVTEVIGLLGRGDRTARRALVTTEAHWDKVVLVHHVGPHLAVRTFYQLLDLLEVRVDDPCPRHRLERVPAGVPDGHVPGHGLRVDSGQLGCGVGAVREVEGFQYLHDVPARLGHRPSGRFLTAIRMPSRTPERRAVLVDDADFCCPPTWSSAVRQRGVCCPPTWSMSCPWS
jgi:hypothetical protein